PRVRRLRILAALALASGPLPAVLIREVADDWGAELAGALDSHQPAGWGPAITATAGDARRALPLVSLAPVAAAGRAGAEWRVAADVVDGPPGGRQVMVEVDDLGRAHLRFSLGDQPDGPVEAHYQVGQGVAGNLPAEAINAVVALTPGAHAAASAIQRVGNPLPVAGGADPETIVAAKAALPRGFLVAQPRAVVADDYTALAARVPGVGRAATALRGTGTGYAADIAIQPSVGEDPDQELLAAVADALEPLRRLGHDVWVRPPSYRPLVIGLNVDVGPDMVRAEVTSEVAAVLSSGWQTDGTPGLFNPRRMGFGEAVFASAVVAAVQDIAGVAAVELTRLGFLRPPGATVPPQPPQYLRLRPSEIARLDNDPDAPEHGYTIINLQGGR
nr:baseplate J/gp47 family protein [Actinomycetota bacterium]